MVTIELALNFWGISTSLDGAIHSRGGVLYQNFLHRCPPTYETGIRILVKYTLILILYNIML